MTYEQFVAAVQDSLGTGRDGAERATRATVRTRADRMSVPRVRRPVGQAGADLNHRQPSISSHPRWAWELSCEGRFVPRVWRRWVVASVGAAGEGSGRRCYERNR
jgi:hypothetical protein